MKARSYLIRGGDVDPLTFAGIFSVSLLGHMVLFAAMILAPARAPEKNAFQAINVSMVSLSDVVEIKGVEPAATAASPSPVVESRPLPEPVPEKKPAPEPPPKETVAAPLPEPKPEAVPIGSKTQPEKPKPKIKRSLKKKTFKPKRAVKKAIANIEKRVDQSRPDPLAQAFDRLRQKVNTAEAAQASEPVKSSGRSSTGAGLSGGSGGDGKTTLELIDIYRQDIAHQVQKNWAFSEQLAGLRNDLKAKLVFKVMPSGEIRDIFFTDRSGSAYLDESAARAVMKANPVSPHPDGLRKPFVLVGLRFGPKGLE